MIWAAARNSAPSSRYSTASEVMTTTSERALLMGWVWTRRLMAPARQHPAKIKNRIRCIVPPLRADSQFPYRRKDGAMWIFLPPRRREAVCEDPGREKSHATSSTLPAATLNLQQGLEPDPTKPGKVYGEGQRSARCRLR